MTRPRSWRLAVTDHPPYGGLGPRQRIANPNRPWAMGQLRHLYVQLEAAGLHGLALGLLHPAIAHLEAADVEDEDERDYQAGLAQERNERDV